MNGPGTIPNYSMNMHQVGLSCVWSLLLSVSVISAVLRYDKIAAITHAIFGWVILIFSFVFVLLLLAPWGFNLDNSMGWITYSHGIVGVMLFGLVVIQVGTGAVARELQHRASISINKIRILRSFHRYLGYINYIAYNVLLLIAWYPNNAFYGFIAWDSFWILVFLFVKFFTPKMERKITDPQTNNYICPSVGSINDVKKATENYVIFADYVYDARNFEKYHPGGYKVIQLVKGREVDRFIYGMYSVELYPQLAPFSHSGNAMQKIGNPIAKLVTPSTYSGIKYEVNDGNIKYMNCISLKTQIYSIGIVQGYMPLVFLGYSDPRQLGQYYSLTINKKITRLYTAVNFLSLANIRRMDIMLQPQRDSQMKRIAPRKSRMQAELPQIINPDLAKQNRQKLLSNTMETSEGNYLPMMMKVYNDGKLTSALRSSNFLNINVKFSAPRGRGLELQITKPGRIIVLAGGTGLFPFSDLIDLLYKDFMIKKRHKMSDQLLNADPILKVNPFERFTFIFLIAVSEPEDIHPITMGQLTKLSEYQQKVKIVLRVSKNANELRKTGKIQLTRQYFNKRVVTEADVKGLSRVWICGPPKMSQETAYILAEKGYTNKQFLLL